MLMQVYWVKSPSEIIPAVVKRQGRLYAWIAVLDQQNDQVEYVHLEKRFLQPRHLHEAIDEREATETQKRAARKLILGNS
jgi:hypothetical protein